EQAENGRHEDRNDEEGRHVEQHGKRPFCGTREQETAQTCCGRVAKVFPELLQCYRLPSAALLPVRSLCVALRGRFEIAAKAARSFGAFNSKEKERGFRRALCIACLRRRLSAWRTGSCGALSCGRTSCARPRASRGS